jgi:hypothetical protein
MKYSYSYKLDSSSEIIGYVHANSMPEAVYMISIKKDLPDSEVVKLFNIYMISNNQHEHTTHNSFE